MSKTFDEDVDEIRRALFLHRLGPYRGIIQKSYRPTRFEIVMAAAIFVAGLPIALVLQAIRW